MNLLPAVNTTIKIETNIGDAIGNSPAVARRSTYTSQTNAGTVDDLPQPTEPTESNATKADAYR